MLLPGSTTGPDGRELLSGFFDTVDEVVEVVNGHDGEVVFEQNQGDTIYVIFAVGQATAEPDPEDALTEIVNAVTFEATA